MKFRILASVVALTTAVASTPANAEDLSHINQLLSTKQCPLCDLSGAGLVMTNLSGANLRNANLVNANLSRVNLAGADLTGANLTGASLYGANLSGANLSNTNLSGIDLRNAYLVNVNLTGTSLATAYVEGAIGIPNSAGTAAQFHGWGVVEAQKGKYVVAIEHYNRAVTLDSNYAPAYLARALALYRLGNEAGAIKDAQNAAKLFETQKNPKGQELSQNFVKNIELAREAAKKGNQRGNGNVANAIKAIATLALQLFLR
jgi:uncharacterized protein YjbI with pentapeptide repeats